MIAVGSLVRKRDPALLSEPSLAYPVSHLGMRSAREVEMKMKMAKRMS